MCILCGEKKKKKSLREHFWNWRDLDKGRPAKRGWTVQTLLKKKRLYLWKNQSLLGKFMVVPQGSASSHQQTKTVQNLHRYRQLGGHWTGG